MNRWKKRFGIIAIVVASVAIGAVISFALTRTSSSVPATVRTDLTFSPLVPAGNSVQSSDYSLGTSEDGTQTLMYKVIIGDSSVVVTQYAQPKQFVDVPEYKERFLSSVVNQTNAVQSSNGVIYTGVTDTDNRQIAVMLERGLLIFFNPSGELSDETWRTIGDSLTIEKTTN
ncbi:hypothetical protein H7142_00965 [Candidatus Saccharibacteria bacterium]|nr:hypothetical protein [Candidatus Saccharibacteria bacterium]